jgi:hypothetical protein
MIKNIIAFDDSESERNYDYVTFTAVEANVTCGIRNNSGYAVDI